MKKTQVIDLIRNIKGSFVSFFSITLFVALGVAIFLGMGWAGRALAMCVDNEQRADNFRDLEIISPYGFTPQDLDELRKVEGVETVEGTYNYYGYFKLGDVKYQAKICTVQKVLNQFFELEGEIPVKGNEVLIEKNWAKKHDVNIGDTISFTHDAKKYNHALSILLENEDKLDDLEAVMKLLDGDQTDSDGMQALNYDSYTVTGLAESPEYISIFPETYGTSATVGTPVDCIMYIPEAGFDARSFTGYSNVFVKSNYITGLYSDESVQDETNAFKDRVDVVVKDLTSKKNKKILDIANTLKDKLDKAPQEIDDYQKKIDEGNVQIEMGEKMLDQGRQQLDAGRSMLESGRNMLENTRSQIEDRVAQFDDYVEKIEELVPGAKETLARLEKIVSSGEDGMELIKKYKLDLVIDNGSTFLTMVAGFYALLGDEYNAQRYLNMAEDYDAFKKKVEESEVDKDFKKILKQLPSIISTIRTAINSKDILIERAEAYIEELFENLESAISQTEESQAKLNSSQATINSNQQTIDENKKTIADYQTKIDDARKLLEGTSARQLKVATSELKDYSSAVLTRVNNPTNNSVMGIKEILSRVKFSLASLFFIVGVLVCYSALSRIIYSHIKLLGTKKALGLNKGEITLSYLLYGASATVMGSILGFIGAYLAIQPIVIVTLGRNYSFRNHYYYYSIQETLIICSIEMVIILLSTYLACRSILKQNPVVLLAGPQPPSGKHHAYERTRFWKRLSLFSKTMFNNVMTDKRRVLGTLIGIAGCTSMLVCGTCIKFNADTSPVVEFGELNKFDTLILFDGKEEGCKDKIQALLDSENIPTSSFSSCYMRNVVPTGGIGMCYLYVSDDEKFTDNFILRTNNGHIKGLADGARVSNGFAETYDIDPGDDVEFIDSTGQHFFIPYIGEFECYLPRMVVVLTAETYERYSKAEYRANSFTMNNKGLDREKLQAELEKIPGFITLYDYLDSNTKGFAAVSSAMSIISLVAIFLAVVMAFLVLLNLLVMHVEEKKREMIILMINGYSVKDAKKYVYKDTIFLTAVGILIGVVLGTILGIYNLLVFSYAPAHFFRAISWPAIGFGIVVAAILALINALIAMRRIKTFNLTDINK